MSKLIIKRGKDKLGDAGDSHGAALTYTGDLDHDVGQWWITMNLTRKLCSGYQVKHMRDLWIWKEL